MAIMVIISIISITCGVILSLLFIKRKSRSEHWPKMTNRTEHGVGMQDNTGDMQATCPFCGNKQKAQSKFCIQCGQKMAVEQPEVKYCPHCGIKLDGNMIFCKECGRKL